MAKILIVGDLHERENLGYADYIKDRRTQEKKEVFDFIIKKAEECDKVVFVGDIFNGRNNPSTVITRVTNFIERFGDKEIYLIGGNHDKKADGTSSIDYLKEVRKKNWHVITDEVTIIDDMVFCPYFTRQEMEAKDNKDATGRLQFLLNGREKKMLFVHHAISGTKVTQNVTTDFFDEIILNRQQLEAEYEFICGGHIHQSSNEGKVLVAGSVFNNEAGEHGKHIWIYDTEEKKATGLKLPGRGIYKVENNIKELEAIPDESIVKFILTDKEVPVEEVKKALGRFDTSLLLERYPSARKKIKMENNSLDFEPEKLLAVYAEERGIDLKKLIAAYKIIK